MKITAAMISRVSLKIIAFYVMCSSWLISAKTIEASSNGDGANVVGESFQCPVELCRCGLDPRGRIKVVCDGGQLLESTSITQAIDTLTEVLIISAPLGRPNMLTIGPIFQGLMKLEELKITQSSIPAIGKHSFWGLRSLRVLDLSQNNISALVESNFRGLVNLEELRLSDNAIESVPSAVFRYLPALRRLSLAQNRVPEFVPRMFYGLHRLEEIDLSGNLLKELDPEVFRDVRLLRTLRCRRCGLKLINPLLLHLLPDLITLDLGDNNLHYVEKNAFGDLRHLRNLFLDGNKIAVISSGTLGGHDFLRLSLARNKILTIDPAAFSNATVSELDVSNNRLQSLDPTIFSPLESSLSRLKIGGNPLQVSHLWSSVLSPSARLSLKELDVSDIPIGRDQHFQSDLFAFQRGMTNLNLSNTGLSFLPVELVQTLPALKVLDVSSNQLTSLTDLTLAALSVNIALQKVLLHRNPFLCSACSIGPLLKWIDASPSTRRMRDGCRGLHASSASAMSYYDDDDGDRFPCPTCQSPAAVVGVELPRLDHINLPDCNYPPSLFDLHGSAKVRPDGAATAGAFMDNPTYIALLCGLCVLVLAALIAALAVAVRHTASYYTYEDRRSKLEAAAAGNGEKNHEEILLMTNKHREIKLVESERKQLNKNNNSKPQRAIDDESPKKNEQTAVTNVANRGVHCPGITTVYPLSNENKDRSFC